MFKGDIPDEGFADKETDRSTTFKVSDEVLVVPPDVPFMVSEYVPAATLEVDIVRVEFAELSAGGVTDEGLKLAEAPEGRPETDNETDELKPSEEDIVAVTD